MINRLARWDSWKTSCASRQSPQTANEKCGTTYGHRSDGCWFITLYRLMFARGGCKWWNINQGEHPCVCFHLYPTGVYCQSGYELIHYAGGRCLHSSALCYFSFTAPHGAGARSHWTPLQSTASLCSLVQGLACWQMAQRRGPRRVLSEAVSGVLLQHNLRGCAGEGRRREETVDEKKKGEAAHKMYPQKVLWAA